MTDWHLYLISTTKGPSTYVGVTTEPERRLKEHNHLFNDKKKKKGRVKSKSTTSKGTKEGKWRFVFIISGNFGEEEYGQSSIAPSMHSLERHYHDQRRPVPRFNSHKKLKIDGRLKFQEQCKSKTIKQAISVLHSLLTSTEYYDHRFRTTLKLKFDFSYMPEAKPINFETMFLGHSCA
jgi:hypothetical protein